MIKLSIEIDYTGAEKERESLRRLGMAMYALSASDKEIGTSLSADIDDEALTKAVAQAVDKVAESSIVENDEQPKAKKSTGKKPEAKKAQDPEQATEQENEEPKEKAKADKEEKTSKKEESSEGAPARSIDEVRQLLAQKKDTHRDVIRAELTRLGAKSVSALDPSNYDGFYAFMENL